MPVIISPNIKKESVRIDTAGNVIDPRSKQILVPNTPDYVPPAQTVAPQATESPTIAPKVEDTPKSIQEEILKAEAYVASLKEKKRLKIEQMKKELADLES